MTRIKNHGENGYNVVTVLWYPRFWIRYGIAVFAVVLSTLLTFALRPVLGPQTHFLTFTLAVIACAWYGGLGPGLTATATGFLSADYFFIDPLYSLWPMEAEDMVLLTVVGVSVSILTGRLSRTEATLALAARAAGVGIYDWTLPKQRMRWSPELAAILGTDPAVLRGAPGALFDRVCPEDRSRVDAEIQDTLAQHQTEGTQEFRIVRTDGEIRWIEVRSRVVYKRSGAAVRAFGAVIDITERRNREMERERLIENERAALREAEEARRALAASNEDLQRFASAVSHDLQAPLRTIGIYTELLVKRGGSALDEESRRLAAAVVGGVRQLGEMVQGLLEFCRAEYGREAPESPSDANGALERALEYLRPQIEESGAVITFDLLPAVPVDSNRLLQVFLNLVSNAIKYRGTSTPRVHISARHCGDHWRFTVSDNGIGISPNHHERIFGIFERLHTGSEIAGAGVGLATVRRLVESAGGRIWVDSDVGRGSAFSFSLPDSGAPN